MLGSKRAKARTKLNAGDAVGARKMIEQLNGKGLKRTDLDAFFTAGEMKQLQNAGRSKKKPAKEPKFVKSYGRVTKV